MTAPCGSTGDTDRRVSLQYRQVPLAGTDDVGRVVEGQESGDVRGERHGTDPAAMQVHDHNPGPVERAATDIGGPRDRQPLLDHRAEAGAEVSHRRTPSAPSR